MHSAIVPLMIFILFILTGAIQRTDAQQVESYPFVLGADVSFFDQLDQQGAVYKEAGVSKELFGLLRDNGVNTIRLRLWHSPDPKWNSLERTLDVAERVHAAGLDLLLDIHFSDTWADPGKQTKPRAWEGLGFEELADSVYAYTYDVLNRLREQGTPPAYVQLGNEISVGMLWDDGRVGGSFDTPAQWRQLGTLLKQATGAVSDVFSGASSPRIIIHTDHGGDLAAATWFFGHLEEEAVSYDVIGLSYYPFWHGSLEDLETTLYGVTDQFNKPVILVETGYPWTLDWFDNVHNLIGLPEHVLPGFEATPDGQYRFLKRILDVVSSVPASKGWGVVYWAPEYISVPGIGSSWENMTLFNEEGEALPGLNAFKEEAESVQIEPVKADRQLDKRITFYPVPFDTVLHLEVQSSEPARLTLKIYNVLGQELYTYETQVYSGKQRIQVDLQEMPTGMLLYKGTLGETPLTGTLITL